MQPDEKNASPETVREPYEKPTVSAVELFADQVLGIGCKGGTEPAMSVSTCATGCFNQGS
jgi:hypothetical protein